MKEQEIQRPNYDKLLHVDLSQKENGRKKRPNIIFMYEGYWVGEGSDLKM